MTDNDELSDARLVEMVAEIDNNLAQLVQARLRRLRLERVVGPARVNFTAAANGPVFVRAQRAITEAIRRMGH